MYNDFIVKVHRYWEEDNGSRGWDGWYFSKVYAIDGNEFLVYDDGGMSAYNGEEDFCETGFNWVDFTATMDRCGENGRQPIVEPLASFNITDYLADRKTEPQTIRCPKCGRSDYIREFGKDFSVTAEKAGFKYKCINCNTYIEPQSDRKTESSSEKPNNCEHITEDGVTCAKYPACEDCLDNPLNKLKGSERLVKGSEQTDLVEDSPSLVKDLVKAFGEDGTWLERQGVYTLTLAEAKQRAVDIIESVLAKTEPTISKMEQVDEPQTDCAWMKGE